MRGCREGWFGFWVGLVADGDATAGGEATGDELLCDMTAVILSGRRGWRGADQPGCAPQVLVCCGRRCAGRESGVLYGATRACSSPTSQVVGPSIARAALGNPQSRLIHTVDEAMSGRRRRGRKRGTRQRRSVGSQVQLCVSSDIGRRATRKAVDSE